MFYKLFFVSLCKEIIGTLCFVLCVEDACFNTLLRREAFCSVWSKQIPVSFKTMKRSKTVICITFYFKTFLKLQIERWVLMKTTTATTTNCSMDRRKNKNLMTSTQVDTGGPTESSSPTTIESERYLHARNDSKWQFCSIYTFGRRHIQVS